MRAKLEILFNIFILAKSLPSQAIREFTVLENVYYRKCGN